MTKLFGGGPMPLPACLLAAVDWLDVPLAVLGLLLIGGALVAGLARRSLLSLAALFVIVGLALGDAGLGVLELDPRPATSSPASLSWR